MSTKNILTFLTGISAGVVLGILFAPDKGSSTRQKIASGTGDIADSIKESFGDFIDSVKKTVDTATKQGEKAMNDASNTVKESGV